jgi:two-component system, cell cycle response regulator DivK
VSNLSTSKRTLMALRDECDRLCLVARRHDERLRDVVQALEAARDVNGSSAEAVSLAERVLHSGSQVQVMAQSLLARLEAEAAERTPAGAHPITAVLVVDDIEDARVLIAETLLQAGFLVRTAENGLDALIAAYEWQPAVIVMDITMPVLDGIEATRLIKAGKATRDARVIAHTAKPGSAAIYLQQLFDAVVPKPCMPDMLLGAVREAASRPGRENH